MANRYWVGGSGNWGDAANHWAASSGGSANASNLPTIEDNVYFDANSFDASGTITLDISANCKNFDWTGLDNSVWFTSAVQSAYIYGDVSLNQNLTYTFTGTAYTYLKSAITTNIRTNNTIFSPNYLYFDNNSGVWNLQDNFKTGTWGTRLYVTAGTINTNDNTLGSGSPTGTGFFYFFITGSSTNINLGNSVIGQCNWRCQNTNASINCGTSTIYSYNYFEGSNKTYYNVYVTYVFDNYIIGNNTFNNLVCIPSGGDYRIGLVLSGDQIINNIFELRGFNDPRYRILAYSSALNTPRKIIANDISIAYSDFRDISVGGSANWDLSNIPGGAGDCGGNTGITFTPSTSCYFVHTSGTCYWSDASKWMTTSGGNIPARVPLPQDDVTFDENSFTGDSTLIGNCMRLGKNINMKAVDVSLLFDLRQSSACYGDYILNSNISRTGNYRTNLMGRDKNYIVDVSGTSVYGFHIYGNYTAMSDLIIHNHISTREGCVFDANDFDIRKIDPTVTWEWMTLDGSVKMGNGTWEFNLGQISNISLMDAGKPPTLIDPEGSTVKFNPPASESRDLTIYLKDNPDVRLNRLHLSGKHTGNYRFVYQGAHINELIIDPGRKVQFLDSRIYRIYNRLVASGTPDASIYIGNTNLSVPFILDSSSSSARIQVDYCYIQRSQATPNNRWYARNSVDLGNNTGWIFKEYNLKPIRVGNTILDKFIEKE
jgi:hypothetical protein